MKRFLRLSANILWYMLSLSAIFIILFTFGYLYLESRLPNVESLKTVKLQVPLRIYTADNELLAEFGEKRRIPITMDEIPHQLVQALLSTEDQRFYEHPGVDIKGLIRAAIQLVRTGEKSQGGSTITMQVARNFFLNRKKTYIRKINEILLAIEIDRKLSKDKILELYLNKIYLGNRAYGVAAAAQVYYGKRPHELTLAQMAMLAGLPKAPSTLNPLANPSAALKRRNHVLYRMFQQGHLDKKSYEEAIITPLTATYHGRKITVDGLYVAEMVRQFMVSNFGKETYTNGYEVFTSINSKLQHAANHSVQQGLLEYDERHGYRGPTMHLDNSFVDNREKWLSTLESLPTFLDHIPVAILDFDNTQLKLINRDGDSLILPWSTSKIHLALENGKIGKLAETPMEVFKTGDVIYVKPYKESWQITQSPNAEAALVSMNPKDGAITALVGGFDFNKSNYNRATQATRQPGSSFKPFIFAAALDKGLTLATIINDAPIVLDDPSQENLWRPQNSNRKFYGPTTLRTGLIRSRNLVSIRLLDKIGIPYTIKYLQKFGFLAEQLPKSLSLALGSLDTTPLELASAYAVFANGGFQIQPYIIDHIRDSNGEILYHSNPKIACPECESNPNQTVVTDIKQLAPRVIDENIAYLMNNALSDVIQHGTGRGAKVLGRSDIAGKTGTTNDKVDVWFAGYNSNIVTVVWAGHDQPQPLYEYASQIALPMWVDFMRIALQGLPVQPFKEPTGIVTVRIDEKTGLLAPANMKHSRFEVFRRENAPQQYTNSPTDGDATSSNSSDGLVEDVEEHLF